MTEQRQPIKEISVDQKPMHLNANTVGQSAERFWELRQVKDENGNIAVLVLSTKYRAGAPRFTTQDTYRAAVIVTDDGRILKSRYGLTTEDRDERPMVGRAA